ncbi:MAG: Sir2 family NAD-dependent protein deacetylase [Deltaproteobacteria bacterium]|nr:Sir2 family NAD-dependent protein deacetylase [Deltaproteobacteria bacterium]
MSEDLHQQAARCAELIRGASRIALLSGAGLSTAAGIQDFRGPNGLYTTAGIENPERIFDIRVFFQQPTLFYSFHRAFLELLDRVEPTFAHRFFAELERQGKLAGIITQNIDSLHQRAGSEKVLEIHGGIWRAYCTECRKEFDYDSTRRLTFEHEVPHCECGGIIKPDIVFFGEAVKHLNECQQMASQSDLFFAVGSSLVVTPAAILPSLAPGPVVVVTMGEISPIFLPPHRIALHADCDIDTFFSAVNDELGLV